MTTRSPVRAIALYGVACVVAIGLVAGVLTVIFTASGERMAVWCSALVALVVQLVAFAIARLLADGGRGIAGWGIGALICLAALVIFGLVSRAVGLPQNAALISLATYFFLTELIEPPLLNV